MRLCINHLTRMQAGCICVAGIDEASGLHIRPVAERQLSTRLLAEYGGPLEFSTIVDVGETQFVGRMPEIEDRRCDFGKCHIIRRLTQQELLDRSINVASASLLEIFGEELQPSRALVHSSYLSTAGYARSAAGGQRGRGSYSMNMGSRSFLVSTNRFTCSCPLPIFACFVASILNPTPKRLSR
ncbi:MAG: hypothetical protein R3C53_19930 [Pirellulaceae bacterium]